MCMHTDYVDVAIVCHGMAMAMDAWVIPCIAYAYIYIHIYIHIYACLIYNP